MSYLHCPTCRCAYNVTTQPACPSCGIRPGTPADPTEDVVVAAEQLARAMARATPSQLADAEATLEARSERLALPAVAGASGPAPSILRAVRAALSPPAPSINAQHALLTTVVLALLTRLVPPQRALTVRATRSMTAWSSRARALLARF